MVPRAHSNYDTSWSPAVHTWHLAEDGVSAPACKWPQAQAHPFVDRGERGFGPQPMMANSPDTNKCRLARVSFVSPRHVLVSSGHTATPTFRPPPLEPPFTRGNHCCRVAHGCSKGSSRVSGCVVWLGIFSDRLICLSSSDK